MFGYCYDLSSLDKTRALAAHVRKDLDTFFGGKLDVLVNNAGKSLVGDSKVKGLKRDEAPCQ